VNTHTLRLAGFPQAWRFQALAWLALVACLMFVYRDTGAAMVAIWIRSETFAHAFVVPPIVMWLAWRQREALALLTPRPWLPMLLPMAAAGALWLLGDLVSANAAEQLGYTAMLVLSVPLMLGRQVTGTLLFPLCFAFFAVPIGEFLTPVLMQWTADFTVAALRASGVPVYREGLQFVIPSGTWSVIEACSGIRYLMASFMVGSLFAYLNYQRPWKRVAFGVVSILMPIVANWLRAYMIVMLGHLSDNRIATGVDHLVYGWVFFGMVILSMFFIGARWADPNAVAATPGVSPGPRATGPAATWQTFAAAAAVAATVLTTLAVAQRLQATAHAAPPLLSLPGKLSEGWTAAETPLSNWRPTYIGPAADVDQTYAGPEGRVAVYLVYYRNQTADSKLVSSSNVMVSSDSRQWIELRHGVQTLSLPQGDVQFRTADLLSTASVPDRSPLRVWHLYWIQGQWTTSDVAAKLHNAWQRLSGQGDESAAVVLYTRNDQPAAAERRLSAFARANLGVLEAQLAATARAR
jgi:exosortase A